MSLYDLLIFDLDGTVIDSRDDIADAVNATLLEISRTEMDREKIYSYVGSGVRQLLRDVLGGIGTKEYEDALVVFKGFYMSGLLNKTKCYDGVYEILNHYNDRLKAVATNKSIGYTEKIIEGLCLSPMFDLVVGSEDGIELKPSPYMLNYILNKLHVSKEKALMIGDGVNDILAARAAGINVCAVGYGIGSKEEILEMNPDYFINDIMELKKIVL